MSERPVAVLRNRLYVPADQVLDSDYEAFSYQIVDYASQIPATVTTYKELAGGWIGFARGNMGKINDIFQERFEIEDERAVVPHGFNLKFTGALRTEQLAVWQKWLDSQYGLIKCPPRWGKTVFAVHMISKLKQRTMVLAHESGILQQFEDAVRKFTNINELEKEHGIPLCGQLKEYDDAFPIVTFSTWQMLHQPGAAEAKKKNRDAFGLMIIDEAHACAAPCFSQVVQAFNPYYRVPLTATDKRKDGLDVVVSDISGPVIAEGISEGLPVDVYVMWTKCEIKPFANWNSLFSQLSKSEPRNRFIAQWVAQDVADGRSCLVITDRRQHAAILEQYIKEENPKITTDVLIGGSAKTSIRDRARSGDTQVVIASPKIVQLGWDVPKWSALHNTLPMANEPNWYQRISRVRTRCDNCPGPESPLCTKIQECIKEKPIARIYADPGNSVTYSCLGVMNRVHTKLGFKVEQVKQQKANTGTTRAKSWSNLDF